jgi:hypothetical protein
MRRSFSYNRRTQEDHFGLPVFSARRPCEVSIDTNHIVIFGQSEGGLVTVAYAEGMSWDKLQAETNGATENDQNVSKVAVKGQE